MVFDLSLIDRLKDVESLVEYEGPIVVLMRDPIDAQLYVYVWTDVLNADSYVWYLAPITEEIVEMLKIGQIDQYTAFLSAAKCCLVYTPLPLDGIDDTAIVDYPTDAPYILKLLEGHKGLFLHWGDET